MFRKDLDVVSIANKRNIDWMCRVDKHQGLGEGVCVPCRCGGPWGHCSLQQLIAGGCGLHHELK